MNRVNRVCEFLGAAYSVRSIDGADAIYRDLSERYEVEVAFVGTPKTTIFVWQKVPHRELVGIYSGVSSEIDLADTLGYLSVKYRNLAGKIQVEREGLEL